MARARKLRSLYRMNGFSPATLATFLQVSSRTVYRWQRHGDAPDAVLKLLRWMTWREFPSADWQGWHFGRNRLWTPEGYSFGPKDF